VYIDWVTFFKDGKNMCRVKPLREGGREGGGVSKIEGRGQGDSPSLNPCFGSVPYLWAFTHIKARDQHYHQLKT
jgi:hypothetical protein